MRVGVRLTNGRLGTFLANIIAGHCRSTGQVDLFNFNLNTKLMILSLVSNMLFAKSRVVS